MKLVWNLVKKASSLCRKERPLNGKRMHPSVAEDENEILDNQDTRNVVLETMEADVLNNNLPPLVESQTVVLPEGENHFNGESQCEPKVETGSQVQIAIHNDVQNESSEKKSETSIQAASTGESGAVVSSEDSENDDNELEGEPKKKRKLNTDGTLEEDRITQEWDNDMKLIKRNLGRISRLFEVYDGYRDKKKPLAINSDLMIHESVMDGKTTPAGNTLELAKLQATLVPLPSPANILGRQQMLESFKLSSEIIIPEVWGKSSIHGKASIQKSSIGGKTSVKSVTFDPIIEVSKLA